MSTRISRTLTVAAVATPLLFAAALAASGPAVAATAAPAAFPHYNHLRQAATYSTWGGYADTGTTFTSVSGAWTVSTLNCSATPTSGISPWIGIDGYTSQTVEQIGYDQDCTNGVASYHPWVEMYPAGSIYFTETVKAGDKITASVKVSGTTFTLTESDTTQGWTKTYHKTGNDKRNSAEAILENFSGGKVAQFSPLTFTDVTANGKPLASAGTPHSTVLGSGSTQQAKNSSLNGGQFTMTWVHS